MNPPHFDNDDSEASTSARPCALGLLVGTLALMTAHAAPEPGSAMHDSVKRGLMARKIVSNLFFLQHHPDAPAQLRQVAANMHARWLPMAKARAQEESTEVADAAALAQLAPASLLH